LTAGEANFLVLLDLFPEPSGCGLLAVMVFVVLARRKVACH
jgi:hypothetical protein